MKTPAHGPEVLFQLLSPIDFDLLRSKDFIRFYCVGSAPEMREVGERMEIAQALASAGACSPASTRTP